MGALLENRVAIITGAGRGIGYGIAEAFCREAATVIIGELVEERGEEAAAKLRGAGFRAEAITLDVTQVESCHQIARRVLAAYGQIDILVNNAGVFFLHKSEDVPEDHWRIQMDVMLNGAFFMTQAVARQAHHRRAPHHFGGQGDLGRAVPRVEGQTPARLFLSRAHRAGQCHCRVTVPPADSKRHHSGSSGPRRGAL